VVQVDNLFHNLGSGSLEVLLSCRGRIKKRANKEGAGSGRFFTVKPSGVAFRSTKLNSKHVQNDVEEEQRSHDGNHGS
jgi:hypothetical protein